MCLNFDWTMQAFWFLMGFNKQVGLRWGMSDRRSPMCL